MDVGRNMCDDVWYIKVGYEMASTAYVVAREKKFVAQVN